MAEQDLDRAQVCSGLEQVCRPAVAQGVRRYVLLDARIARGFFTGVPDSLVRHGSVRAAVAFTAGEEVDARLLPAPILAQRLQQCRAEWDVATAATLATFHADHHAPAVDVAHLQQRYFHPPHARAIKRHQQGALHEVAGGIDKPGDLVQTEHRRQSAPILRVLRIRQLLPEVAPLEGANEEEPQRGDPAHHASHRQLALREQIGLIASELVWPQLVWGFSKVFSELLNGT